MEIKDLQGHLADYNMVKWAHNDCVDVLKNPKNKTVYIYWVLKDLLICQRISSCFALQLVDKLNTNTEMEEMINDYNIVSRST